MALQEHTGEFDASPAYIKGIVLEFCNSCSVIFSHFMGSLGMLVFFCERDSYWNQEDFLMISFSTLSYWIKVLIQIAWYVLQTCVHYSNFSYLLLSRVSTAHIFLKALSRNWQKQGKDFKKPSAVKVFGIQFYSSSQSSCPDPWWVWERPWHIFKDSLYPMPEDQNSELFIKLNWCFSVMSNVQN